MKITRQDCKDQFQLIEKLEQWEKISGITGRNNQGVITLRMQGCQVNFCLDEQSLNTIPDKTQVNICNKEIGLLLGTRIKEMVEEVKDIIKTHLPIELS